MEFHKNLKVLSIYYIKSLSINDYNIIKLLFLWLQNELVKAIKQQDVNNLEIKMINNDKTYNKKLSKTLF